MNRIGIAFVIVIGVFASEAHATEQQMVVNEIMISSGGDATAQLLELRDIGDESFDNPTYAVDIFDAAGTVLGRVATPGITGGNGPRFYVLSTAAADSQLGITGNAPLTTALPRDGQACFIGTADRKIHCVAWGCVTTKVTPATPLGASPDDTMSLQRTPSGAALTVAGPTPGADNADGLMDDPCPNGPEHDGEGTMDDPGGCCQSSRPSPTGMLITLAVVLSLTVPRRRRFV
jgi:hypothetical protein